MAPRQTNICTAKIKQQPILTSRRCRQTFQRQHLLKLKLQKSIKNIVQQLIGGRETYGELIITESQWEQKCKINQVKAERSN